MYLSLYIVVYGIKALALDFFLEQELFEIKIKVFLIMYIVCNVC